MIYAISAQPSVIYSNFPYIDGLVEDCSIFTELAMKILQSCNKQKICSPVITNS